LIETVLANRPDIVWNMAEGEGVGRSREARVPAFLEMLNIPYTGSDPLTLAASLDKQVAKRWLEGDGAIRVPEGVELPPGCLHSTFVFGISELLKRGPILLKPSFEGSSKGIRSRCLVSTIDEAWETFRVLSRDYRQTILAEEFISGDEVTVGLVGNGKDLEAIGVMRVVPRQPEPHFIYSLEVKRDWRNRVNYETPARLDPGAMSQVVDVAKRSYERLGCRDLARIDLRIRDNLPYFIEANPLPGLAPGTSDLVILAEGYGIPYPSLIGRIFGTAMKRLGMVER